MRSTASEQNAGFRIASFLMAEVAAACEFPIDDSACVEEMLVRVQ